MTTHKSVKSCNYLYRNIAHIRLNEIVDFHNYMWSSVFAITSRHAESVGFEIRLSIDGEVFVYNTADCTAMLIRHDQPTICKIAYLVNHDKVVAWLKEEWKERYAPL